MYVYFKNVLCCLETDSPSAGSGIIFDIYDQDSIPKAIKLLIKNTGNMGGDNDNEFKKVTQTLCTWLRTFSGLKNLSHCIIHFLDGLRVRHEIQRIDFCFVFSMHFDLQFDLLMW